MKSFFFAEDPIVNFKIKNSIFSEGIFTFFEFIPAAIIENSGTKDKVLGRSGTIFFVENYLKSKKFSKN